MRLSIEEEDELLSERAVSLGQIFFALVIGLGIIENRFVVVSFWSFPVGALALAATFTAILSGWIGWHRSVANHPYMLSKPVESIRLAVDLSIVLVYAYLLFTVESILQRTDSAVVYEPGADISAHLWGYVVLFLFFLLSAALRRVTHPPEGNALKPWRPILLVTFLLSFLVVVLLYSALQPLKEHAPAVNGGALGLVIAVLVAFRLVIAARRKDERRSG